MQVTIQVITVGNWKVNCYLISVNGEGWLLDPGDESERIVSNFNLNNYNLKGIINTHGHFDHIGAVSEIKEKYKIPFLIHSKDKRLVYQSNLYRRIAGDASIVKTPTIDGYLDDLQFLELHNERIWIHYIPGHTDGGVCFEINGNLFIGDLFFEKKIGRTDLPGGNKSSLSNSINYVFDQFRISNSSRTWRIIYSRRKSSAETEIDNTMGLVINKVEYYLPEKVVTNEDLAKGNPDWDIEKTEAKSGVKSRHIAYTDQTSLDLAIKAVEKVLLTGKEVKDQIGAIIFCTQSPDYIMPSNSFLIHKHFGFDEDVWTFDYNLACSGYIFGLAISRGIIETRLAKNILLITSDTYSKYLNRKDRSTNILFGDGAAASIVSSDKKRGIIDIILSSNGEKFDTFYIPAGGCKLPKDIHTKKTTIDFSGNERNLENIHMNGFAVWQFISKKVPDQINNLLMRNKLSVDDIDLFVFHQASKLTLDSLIKVLKISKNKVIINLKDIGNTVSSSIPIALKDAEETGRLKKGDLILLSGFGVGLSWGSIIMKY